MQLIKIEFCKLFKISIEIEGNSIKCYFNDAVVGCFLCDIIKVGKFESIVLFLKWRA